MSFRVLIVDDYEPWRKSLCSLLKGHPELRIIGEASDGLEAVREAEALEPDLILLDLALPNLNGKEASICISRLVPESKILFISSITDTDVVREVLNDGAKGYVLKTDARSELLTAIKAILRGESYVSSGIETAGLLAGDD